MTDRIYTYQQKLAIQLMENFTILALAPIPNEKAMRQIFYSLQRTVERDPRMIPELRPSKFFNGTNTVFDGRRGSIDAILTWISELHDYYDKITSSNLAR